MEAKEGETFLKASAPPVLQGLESSCLHLPPFPIQQISSFSNLHSGLKPSLSAWGQTPCPAFACPFLGLSVSFQRSSRSLTVDSCVTLELLSWGPQAQVAPLP